MIASRPYAQYQFRFWRKRERQIEHPAWHANSPKHIRVHNSLGVNQLDEAHRASARMTWCAFTNPHTQKYPSAVYSPNNSTHSNHHHHRNNNNNTTSRVVIAIIVQHHNRGDDGGGTGVYRSANKTVKMLQGKWNEHFQEYIVYTY